MSLTRETLMKMKKDVLTGIVLGYNEKFDSTLSAINDELKELDFSHSIIFFFYFQPVYFFHLLRDFCNVHDPIVAFCLFLL